jgi:hypothetical protein
MLAVLLLLLPFLAVADAPAPSVLSPAAEGTFVDLTGSPDGRLCGRTAKGEARCWGPPGPGAECFARPLPGPFDELAMSTGMTCGRRADGTVACWGASADEQGQTACFAWDTGRPAGFDYAMLRPLDPTVRYRALAMSDDSICGLTTDDRLVCNGYLQLSASVPGARAVAAGDFHACVLGGDGAIRCVGPHVDLVIPEFSMAPLQAPPTGAMKELHMASLVHCGVKADGTLACWGHSIDDGARNTTPLTAAPLPVCAANPQTKGCAEFRFPPEDLYPAEELAEQPDALMYWGVMDYINESFITARTFGTTAWPRDVAFVDLALGSLAACGLRADGGVQCWGAPHTMLNQPSLPSPVPVERIQKLTADPFVCALVEGGRIRCWDPYWPIWGGVPAPKADGKGAATP